MRNFSFGLFFGGYFFFNLFIISSLSDYGRWFDWFPFHAGWPAMLLLMPLGAAVYGIRLREVFSRPRSGFEKYLLLFIAWGFCTAVFSIDPWLSVVRATGWAIAYVFLFKLVYRAVDRGEEFPGVLVTVLPLVVGFFLVLVAAVVIFDPASSTAEGVIDPSTNMGRIGSGEVALPGPIIIGMMGLLGFVLGGTALAISGRWIALVYGPLAFMCVVLVILAASRGAVLALLGAGTILYWTLLRSRIAFPLVVIAAAIFLGLNSIYDIAPRFSWESYRGGIDEAASLRGRWELWRDLIDYTLTVSPFGGFGLGTASELNLPTHRGEASHSSYVEAYVSAGVFGVMLFTGAVVKGLAEILKVWKRILKGSEEYKIVSGLLALYVGLAIHGLFEQTIDSPAFIWTQLFWLSHILTMNVQDFLDRREAADAARPAAAPQPQGLKLRGVVASDR